SPISLAASDRVARHGGGGAMSRRSASAFVSRKETFHLPSSLTRSSVDLTLLPSLEVILNDTVAPSPFTPSLRISTSLIVPFLVMESHPCFRASSDSVRFRISGDTAVQRPLPVRARGAPLLTSACPALRVQY